MAVTGKKNFLLLEALQDGVMKLKSENNATEVSGMSLCRIVV